VRGLSGMEGSRRRDASNLDQGCKDAETRMKLLFHVEDGIESRYMSREEGLDGEEDVP
jgi:hypothetical protein